MLLLSPFMALVMAYGVYIFYDYLLKKNVSKKISSVIIILLVAGFVSTSLVSSGSISDCKDLPWAIPRLYFSHEELQGFNYVLDYVPFGSMLYSDGDVERFFTHRKFSESDILDIPYYRSDRIYHVEDLPKYKGYTIIRDKKFSNVGLYFGHGSFSELYAPTDENTQHLYYHLQKNDKIYSNYAVDIYYS